MTETLFLTIEWRACRWRGVRISRATKKRPTLRVDQALVKLNITIPDGILNPPVINVQIKREHVEQPPISVEVSKG